jgi:hypothetical protein
MFVETRTKTLLEELDGVIDAEILVEVNEALVVLNPDVLVPCTTCNTVPAGIDALAMPLDAVVNVPTISTLPLALIRIASTPPSLNPMMSVPKKIPVFASVPLIAGVAAEPSMSDSPSVPERIKLMVLSQSNF